MLSGKAPFQSSSHRDCSSAAIMERIRGGEFNTKGKEFELVSEQAKKLIEGMSCTCVANNSKCLVSIWLKVVLINKS